MSERIWVKICGVTRVEDAATVAAAGADAIGVNFYRLSPRYCSPAAALRIVAEVSPALRVYGVFVGAGRDFIEHIVSTIGIDGVQLHGNEPAKEAEGWKVPVIRAVALRSRRAAVTALGAAEGYRVLLDSPRGGGSGERFAEDLVEGLDLGGVILAGGLNPANVGGIVCRLHPWGVDCASGVESRPGVKDPVLVKEFVEHARSA